MNDLIPCLGVVGILIVIFGFLAFIRYINYKETLALAEKGLTRPETKNSKGLLPHVVCRANVVHRLPSRQLFIHGRWSLRCYRLRRHTGTRRCSMGILAPGRPTDDDRSAGSRTRRASGGGPLVAPRPASTDTKASSPIGADVPTYRLASVGWLAQ